MQKRIYLDYASSTPVDKKVLKEMMPFFKKEFGNPSSLHSFGQKARAAIEQAREKVATFLHCKPLEVVFTSGATEANNLVIQGVVCMQGSDPCSAARVRTLQRTLQKLHVITSQIEHESVLTPIQELEQKGIIEATYIKPDSEGVIHAEGVLSAIKKNTALVSVMYANSEIGAIQPIAEIGKQLKARTILFHTDAAQAAQFLDCDVEKLGVDLLTLSGHKIYGPKGVGVLYVKEGMTLRPLIVGGGQEQGLRSGTEHVAAIVGMARAIEEIQNPKSKIQSIQIRQLRDKLIKLILLRIKGSCLTGSRTQRLENNVHVRFQGVEGKDLLFALDQKGVAVSTGSACSEKTQEPSHTLLALGLSSEQALGSIRVSLGKYTTAEEIERFLKILCSQVAILRRKLI